MATLLFFAGNSKANNIIFMIAFLLLALINIATLPALCAECVAPYCLQDVGMPR
jgi:hypothetical protein